MRALHQRTPYCCGLHEIGDFRATRYTYDFDLGHHAKPAKLTLDEIKETKRAFICTTRKCDVAHVKELKKWKFKRVGTWVNPNTKNRLTLWAYFPGKKKKPKKKK